MNSVNQKILTGKDFLNSPWLHKGETPAGEAEVNSNYNRWVNRVKNAGLIERASRLWNRLNSGQVTAKEKAAIVAAILYLICPVDMIPDYIPVLGWMDDLGVATFVLNYLDNQATKAEFEQPLYDDIQVAQRYNPSSPLQKDVLPILTQTYEGLPYKVVELQQAAEELGVESFVTMAKDLENDLQGGMFRVLFTGHYNSGKSTIINAFLGKEWLPMGMLPTTKTITHILADKVEALYSEQSSGKIVKHGSVEALFDGNDPDIISANRFSLFLPDTALPDGVTFIDSPGLEDSRQEVSELTLQEVPAADAIVVLLNAKYLESASDMTFIKDLFQQAQDRKLFFVLTHIDMVLPNEQSERIATANRLLQVMGVPNPRIFPLSAKESLRASKEGKEDQLFKQFKKDLLIFLHKDAPNKLRQTFQKRAEFLKAGLLDNCDGILSLADSSREEQLKVSDVARVAREHLQSVVARQEVALERKIEIVHNKFLSNFTDYLGVLEREIADIVDQANSVRDLPQDNIIAKAVKDGTKNFVETEFNKLATEIDVYVGEQTDEILTSVHGLSLPIQVDRSRSLLEANPEIFTAGILVAAFPIVGIFSFAYLAIGAMFGKNILENLVKGIAASVALKKIRPELKLQLANELKKLQPQMVEWSSTAFKELHAVALSRLQAMQAVSFGGLATQSEEESSLTPQKAEQARTIKERLLTWTPSITSTIAKDIHA